MKIAIKPLPAIMAALAIGFAGASEAITPQDFQAIFETVRPKGVEKWQTIPWKSSLLDARDLSVKEGKPLFMWSMNGDPQGCT